MPSITYTPIGIIRSPFRTLEGTPIQPSGAASVKGFIELEPEYVPGLQDLDGFSHILLLYHFHLSKGFSLTVVPFLSEEPRGLFATRAPKRPNPIGLSVVKLTRIEEHILHIENVDVVDKTPLLDLKPHVPHFDAVKNVRTGWLSGISRKAEHQKADRRFK